VVAVRPQTTAIVYMFVLAPFGPSATWPAAKPLRNTSNVRVVPDSFVVSWVPVSTHELSIHGRLPERLSTPTNTVAFWLIVNVATGSAVTVLDEFAVRTHAAPTSAAGRLATGYVRSPLRTSPTCRFVRKDQLAALALSLTTRLLSTSPPPPPTAGSGA